MKKVFTLLTALVLTVSVWAQSPQKMSYQAVMRNSSEALITSTAIGMRISIIQGSASGIPVYVETQSTTTNINGLASIKIGDGMAETGTFAAIDWANGPYFIKTETDPAGGTDYTIAGTSELMSVPYALFSANGTPGVQGEQGPAGETGLPGIAGDKGEQGIPGIPGEQGVKGDKGDAGIQGEQGLQGIQGDQGLKGDVGTPGEQGLKGDKGDAGIQGEQGIQGIPGAQGLKGDPGSDGLTTSVNGITQVAGAITLSKSDINLGNVDNTSDASKPVSTATLTALNLKANTASLATVATTGSYADLLNKPVIPTSQWITAGNNITYASGAIAIAGQSTAYDNTPFTDYNGLVFQAYKIGGLTGTIGNIISTGANSGNWPSALAFSTRNSGGSLSEKVRINDVGNVGIGKTAPAYKLDVAGDVNVTGNFKVNGTNISTTTADGSETKVTAGTNITVTGTGTAGSPYVVNASASSAPTYASINISNAIVVGTQNLSIMSANGLSVTGGTTIALSANTVYEITAVVQIYNTAAEAYTFMFYNETDGYYFNGNPMYFGQPGNDRNYHNEVVDFIFKPTANTNITFKKQSTNTVQGNLIGNIVIKVLK